MGVNKLQNCKHLYLIVTIKLDHCLPNWNDSGSPYRLMTMSPFYPCGKPCSIDRSAIMKSKSTGKEETHRHKSNRRMGTAVLFSSRESNCGDKGQKLGLYRTENDWEGNSINPLIICPSYFQIIQVLKVVSLSRSSGNWP